MSSSILESEPEPIRVLKPQTPPAFEHVVKTCLQKNPEERFQSAHDIKLELQWIAADRSPQTPATQTSPVAPSHTRERLAWAAAIVLAITLGLAAGFVLNRPLSPAESIRTVMDAPPKT